MNPFLSICLIVKNEEKVLRRCLDSIKGIADEIIIVDTGSTDKTKDIAHEYSELVYDCRWEDDFSKARNFAASKASGKWILVIDADEYMDRDSFIKFKNEMLNNPPVANILAVQIVNFTGVKGKNTVLNYHERLYKNDGNISYYRNIHELLQHKDSLEKKGFAQLQIFHSGYMEDVVKEKNKANRNLALLNNIKEKQGYDYFFLGDVYFQLGDLDKAINNYKKAYQLKGSLNYDWVAKLLIKLANCLQAANRNKEAIDVIVASEGIYQNLVDFKFLKGQFYFKNGKEKEAAKIFEEILFKKDQLKANSSIDYLEYLPHKYLGEIYEVENDLHLAVNHYSKSLSINDSDDYVWMRLINLLSKHSTLDELVQFLNNNFLKRTTMTTLRVVNILLSVPNIDVQKLTRSFLNNSELPVKEEQSLLLKNLFLDGNNNEVLKILNHNHLNEILVLLSNRIFHISDLILLALETTDENARSFLYNLKINPSIKNTLNFLFGYKRKKLSDIEEELFIFTLRQAYVMQKEKVIKILNNKIDFLSIKGKKRLKEELGIFNLNTDFLIKIK
jgi:glycosyltransferase involved in cell wall biosynthesis